MAFSEDGSEINKGACSTSHIGLLLMDVLKQRVANGSQHQFLKNIDRGILRSSLGQY